MKLCELLVLLPCHSLEDFPLHLAGPEADGLLAAWSALWHPALLAAARRKPTWQRADAPPDDVAAAAIAIPTVSEGALPAGWALRAEAEAPAAVRKLTHRQELLAALLARLPELPPVEPRLVGDFLALGWAYLELELLTRQMRYVSSFDEVQLERKAVAAADAALAGDAHQVHNHLATCFEILMEARDRFYPAECYLVDLTLVADTTLGEALRLQLASGGAQNVMLSGRLAGELARREPATLAALRQALDERTATIVGGHYDEGPLPLEPLENVLADFHRGLAAYEAHLGRRPTIFGRRRNGLSPILPQLLARLGFVGALHFTLDEGQFPLGQQSKLRWEGLDGSVIDALFKLPLDASLPETFLALPQRIAESMDLDHVATVVLAHWPGVESPYLEDLRRVSRYVPLLGRPICLDEYFRHTETPGRMLRFEADEYRTCYLRQAVIRRQPDPISRHVAEHAAAAARLQFRALAHLAALVDGRSSPESPSNAVTAGDPTEAAAESAAAAAPQDAPQQQTISQPAAAALSANGAPEPPWGPLPEPPAGGPPGAETRELLRRIAAALAGGESAADAGWLVLNPHLEAQTIGLALPSGAEGFGSSAVIAQDPLSDPPRAVVEAPASGFAWISRQPRTAPPTRRRQTLVQDPNLLANSLVEVGVDPASGGIRSIREPRRRGNLLGQQLAFRLPAPDLAAGQPWHDPDLDAVYTTMAADEVQVTLDCAVAGQITSRGRLLDPQGRSLAGFTQQVTLWAHRPLVELAIALDPREVPRADPWNSYYAVRFAWADAAAELARGVHLVRHASDAKRVEAPDYLEIESHERRVAVFPCGLTYHRRVGERMLDTLLVVRGETSRQFRLAIGVGIAHPAAAALALAAPGPLVVPAARPQSPHATGWLFHLDSLNVVATDWEPVWFEGRVLGFRVRLLETEGRPGRVGLSALKPLARAVQYDFAGQPLCELRVERDTLWLDLTAGEWAQVEAHWA